MVVTTAARIAHTQLERLETEGKPADGLRCEILNGELVIGGIPLTRHERPANAFHHHSAAWARQHGNEAFTGAGIEICDHDPASLGRLDVDHRRMRR